MANLSRAYHVFFFAETAHCVETIHVRDTILEADEKKNDDCAKTINTHIGNVVHLVAAAARYHLSWTKKFYQTTSGVKRGCPKTAAVWDAMTHFLPNLRKIDKHANFLSVTF